jgi:hypothetical protein
MIVAPAAGRLEIALPDPEPVATGSTLLSPVSPGGDGKTLGDHGGAKVAARDQAGREQTIVLVHIFRPAISRTGGQQLSHAIVRRTAARPNRTIGMGAILRQLGRIKAEQPDAVLPEAEAIAVAGAGGTRTRLRRLIERGRDDCRGDQKPDGQERPAGAAKQRFALVESRPDFTTR